jgi:hypothetical protein
MVSKKKEWKALESGHLVPPSTGLLFSNPCTDNLGLDFRYHDPPPYRRFSSDRHIAYSTVSYNARHPAF